MKQIPSQFIDDSKYEQLLLFKEKHGYTWKQLMLSVLDDEKEA